MSKSQVEKELIYEIEQLYEVVSMKRSMKVLLVLWVVLGISLLFFVAPLGIIFLVLTSLIILFYHLAYKSKVRYYLMYPD